MLEYPTDSSTTPNIATAKRYALPNQRNRSLGRTKSGIDALESVTSNGDKIQDAVLRNVHVLDHADPPWLIGLQGCCSSEAYQLLNNRWEAAMNAYENPSTDLVERPVMFSGSSESAWGQLQLPHQMVSPKAAIGMSGSQVDFINELRQAMRVIQTVSSDK